MRCLFGYIYLGKSVGRKLVFPCCTSNLILVNEAQNEEGKHVSLHIRRN